MMHQIAICVVQSSPAFFGSSQFPHYYSSTHLAARLFLCIWPPTSLSSRKFGASLPLSFLLLPSASLCLSVCRHQSSSFATSIIGAGSATCDRSLLHCGASLSSAYAEQSPAVKGTARLPETAWMVPACAAQDGLVRIALCGIIIPYPWKGKHKQMGRQRAR